MSSTAAAAALQIHCTQVHCHWEVPSAETAKHVVYNWVPSWEHENCLAHDVMRMPVELSTHLNHSFHIGSCTIVPRVMNRSATRGMNGPCAAHFSCSIQSGRPYDSVLP